MDSSWRTAVAATLHCLTGCAIGEVLGMVLGDLVGLVDGAEPGAGDRAGLLLRLPADLHRPCVAPGSVSARPSASALAADTVSITVMEIVDNAVLVLLPGAMEAALSSPLFWWSLAAALAVAFVVTVPVNRWMIGRGKGHAVVHEMHAHH